jgi:hypothetical protein
MVGVELKTISEVGQVGEVTLIPGIEMNGIASALAGLFLDVLQESRSKAFFMARGDSDQIVNVEDVAPRQSIQETVACAGNDGVSVREVDDLEAFLDLHAPALDQFFLGTQMGAKFLVSVKAAADVTLLPGDADVCEGGLLHRAYLPVTQR